MTATAHALIGASIAVKVVNPILGIPLAIISHFVADLIPHWDAGTNHRQKSLMRLRVEAALDVLLGFALVYLIFRNLVDPRYLFVMVIAAQLPDWLEAPSFMFNINVPPFSWLDWLRHQLKGLTLKRLIGTIYFARSTYSPILVSTRTTSPIFIKSGTFTVNPFSKTASLYVAPTVLPRAEPPV